MKENPHISILFGLNIFARVSALKIDNATEKEKRRPKLFHHPESKQ